METMISNEEAQRLWVYHTLRRIQRRVSLCLWILICFAVADGLIVAARLYMQYGD